MSFLTGNEIKFRYITIILTEHDNSTEQHLVHVNDKTVLTHFKFTMY